MNYYNYGYLSYKKVGIGWVDNRHQMKSPMAVALSQNITEYWTQEIFNYQLLTNINRSADHLLNWAADNDLNYILILSLGNNLSKSYPLLSTLAELIDTNGEDITVMGHILDKNNNYLELHHQAFLVNLNWWKSANRPFIGQEESNINVTVSDFNRSVDNWHDDYTPHWIQYNHKDKIQSNVRHGWNILSYALKSNKKIFSFPEKLRESKFYLYPEVSRDFQNKIHDVFNNLQSYTHFVANTESPIELIDDVKDFKFSAVATAASGITPLLTAWKCNLQPRDRIVVYDYSPVALMFYEHILKTDFDFRNFEENFLKIIKENNLSRLTSTFRATANIKKMENIIHELLPQGLDRFIDEVWPTLDKKLVEVNLFDPYKIKSISLHLKNHKSLIHLTNIFNYQNTAWMYSAEDRYKIEKQIIQILDDELGDNTRIYSTRTCYDKKLKWKGISPSKILENPNLLYKVETLEKLSWYRKN